MDCKHCHEQWKQKTSLDFLWTEGTFVLPGDEAPGPSTLSSKVHASGTGEHPSGTPPSPILFLLQGSTALQCLRMEQRQPPLFALTGDFPR